MELYDEVAQILKFYADPKNYDNGKILECDRGPRAHEALTKMHIIDSKEFSICKALGVGNGK